MFDHVTIRVSDREASRTFYDTVLGALGPLGRSSGDTYDEWGEFSLAEADASNPVTRRLHVAFVTRSEDEVDRFWQVGTQAGYTSDGEPGPRPEYGSGYYGAFVLDPDGNSTEAVYHGRPRRGDVSIDHLWLRVAELEAARRFYETVAPILGLEVDTTDPGRVHVRGGDRSFALVTGDPLTEHVHIAFPAPDDATVDAFHRAALAAGYRDNGPPGDRHYHPGYYGAFVLDADGHNVEAVNHNR